MPVVIDAAICTACGLCLEECPSGTLTSTASAGHPAAEYPERCVQCGHCMAICPVDAVAGVPGEGEVFPLVEDLQPELSPLERLLRLKRSVRAFTDRPLGPQVIESILQYGERAPSSHNFRTRRYSVVTSLEMRRELECAVVRSLVPLRPILNPLVLGAMALFSRETARDLRGLRVAFDKVIGHHRSGGTPIFRSAPCIICVAAASRNSQGRDDCVASLQYMMIYAQGIGISSGTIGYAQHAHKVLEKLLGVPESHTVHAVGILGYPRNTYTRALRYDPPPVEMH